MKKSITIFILLILSMSLFVAATEHEGEESSQKELDLKPEDILLDDELSSNKFLEKEIEIPKSLQLISKVIFGLKDTSLITLDKLIILLSVWLAFFIIMTDILKFSSFQAGTRWALSFCLIILMSVIGVINGISLLIFNLSDSVKWIESLGSFWIIIVILATSAILYLASTLIGSKKNSALIEKARASGMQVKNLISQAKTINKSIESSSQ